MQIKTLQELAVSNEKITATTKTEVVRKRTKYSTGPNQLDYPWCACSAQSLPAPFQMKPPSFKSSVDVPQVPDKLADFVTRLCLNSPGSLKPWQLLVHLKEPAGFPVQAPVPCLAPEATVNTLFSIIC